MIEIKKVGPESVPVIQQIAYATWPVAYAATIPPGKLAYMLELFYSSPSLQHQIENGHQFIIAFEEQPLAFASYSTKENNPSVYKLHKIYILPAHQGKGIGRLLINFIKNDIAGAGALHLNVYRHNNARFFYEKLGFTIIGEEDIDIGNGNFMNDYVMELKL